MILCKTRIELNIEIQSRLKLLSDKEVFKNDRDQISENNSYEKVNMQMKFLIDLKNVIDSTKITQLFQDKNIIPLSTSELYWVTEEYNKIIKENSIEGILEVGLVESEEFTIKEIEEANSLYINEFSGNTDSIILENVIEVKPYDEYLAVISYKELAKMYKNSIITYNFETQREASYENTKFGVLIKPTIYEKNVSDIEKLMLSNDFEANLIILNALKIKNDTTERYRYNEKTKQLQIFRADIVDGFHRQLACTRSLSKNPNLEGHFYLKFTNRTTKEAMKMVIQESQGTKISDERIVELSNNIYNEIVDRLNNDNKSELKNKFGSLEEVKNNLSMIVEMDFINSLQETFKNLEPRDKSFVSKFLIDFYNYIVGKYNNDFKDFKNSKLTSVVCESNIYAFLNYIAAELYEDDYWEDTLEEILNKLSFERSSFWNDLGVNSRIINNTKMRKKMYDYAKEILNEVDK
ncbi:TPA: hypothetical protein ACF2DE_002948 [Clostridium perfringens]